MKTGLLDFADHTTSFQELFVLTFGTRVRMLHDVGQPLSQLESSLKALTVCREHRCCLTRSWKDLRKVSGREPERKALLVFTDGIDTASKSGFKDVLLEAQKAGALLYFIPIGSRILIDEHTIDSACEGNRWASDLSSEIRTVCHRRWKPSGRSLQSSTTSVTTLPGSQASIPFALKRSGIATSRELRAKSGLLQLLNGPVLSENV